MAPRPADLAAARGGAGGGVGRVRAVPREPADRRRGGLRLFVPDRLNLSGAARARGAGGRRPQIVRRDRRLAGLDSAAVRADRSRAARPCGLALEAASGRAGRGYRPAAARHIDGARRLADLDRHQPVTAAPHKPGHVLSTSRLRGGGKAGSLPGWRILGWVVAKTLLRLWKICREWARGEGVWGRCV